MLKGAHPPHPRHAHAPHLRELVDGQVYVYLQPRGGWCVSNAGVIAGERGVTLIDCTATVASAQRMLAHITEVTSSPVDQIVITHHHGDHHFGASTFPQATVITHDETRTAILRDGIDLPRIWPESNWGDIQLVTPDVTFSEQLSLHIDDLRVDLLHFGTAHTRGDIVAWLPDQRLLFAGDLTFSGSTPLVIHGSLQGALDILANLKDLEPAVVVSGHGPVAGSEVIDANLDYLRWVQQIAADGFTAGITPLQAAQQADLGRFRCLQERERLVANLHRAYAEQAGQPLGEYLPIPPALADMVAYKGSPLPCEP